MAGLHWVFRSIPAIASSTLLLLISIAFRICYLNSSYSSSSSSYEPYESDPSRGYGGSGYGTYEYELHGAEKALIFFVAGYITLMHLLGCAFPLRACWAVESTTRAMTLAQARAPQPRSLKKVPENELVELEDSAGETTTQDYVTHAIVLPNYKEDIDTLRDTLNVLASHPAAKDHYDIFLAMEEKDPNAETVAASLIASYQEKFRDIQHTIHPLGLTGEVQGKSSNVSWAASKVGQKYNDTASKRATLVTVMDSDTHLLADYFAYLAEFYERDTQESPQDSLLYMPPIIFDRNAHQVPTLVRVGDILWTGAALSGVYPGSSVCIPTSVYSIPLAFAERIGGWDSGAEAIGEDLHMFLKSFFASRCELKVTPIFSPASHCNIVSSDNGVRGWVDNVRARGKQAMRHMWGSLDSGYAIRQGLLMWWNRAYDQWKTEPKKRRSLELVYVYHRLFEAHFLPLHITIGMLAGIPFDKFLPEEAVPWQLAMAFNVSGWLRLFGFFFTCCWMYLHEQYHHLCVTTREKEMQRAGLLEQSIFSRRTGSLFWVDYLWFPIAGTLYGSAPALIAQSWHVWTDRLDYTVSSKPIRSWA